MEKAHVSLNAGPAALGEPRGSNALDRLSFFLIFATAFLLPVFFIPSVSFPFQQSKISFFTFTITAAFVLWLIGRLRDGTLSIPRTLILASLGILLFAVFLSVAFSATPAISLSGQGFEPGTAVSVLALAILFLLVATLANSKDRIFYCYLAFFFSFFVLSLFQLLRLVFGPAFFSFGVLIDQTSNLIGKWNDLAIFFGFAAVLSLVTLEQIALNRLFKTLVYAALVIALFFLAVVNFSTVWLVLGFFSLMFVVYALSIKENGERFASATDTPNAESSQSAPGKLSHIKSRLPRASLFVLIVSLIFIFGGSTIGAKLSNAFKTIQLEARPSFSATFDVAKATLSRDPLFGAGPARFVNEWVRSKPAGINGTIFWNTDFASGVGFVPTHLVTTGVVGALAWILFLGLYLYVGFRTVLSVIPDKVGRYLATSSFLSSLFLWVIAFLYNPSITILFLAFLFSGLFIASLRQIGSIPSLDFSFSNDPKKGFVAVLAFVLLLIGGVAFGYSVVERYVGAVSFQSGIVNFNRDGNVDRATERIGKAALLDPKDLYFRFLTELDLIRMGTVFNEASRTTPTDALRAQFQAILSNALSDAGQAVALNKTNYENYVTLGRVYEAVVPLRIEGAYESAERSYRQALELNPENPALYLTLARLEAARGDNKKSREFIAQALEKKNNYTEAIFFLSQIEAAEGNIRNAIRSVEAAAVLAPNDPTIFFQLGLLRFNVKDYRGAIEALERSVSLSPAYANAKYFLGLSYDKAGRRADAAAQFRDLRVTNPDNAEVALILKNLEAGKSPFANAAPPIDDKPEKRKRLPVEEKSSKKASARVNEDNAGE